MRKKRINLRQEFGLEEKKKIVQKKQKSAPLQSMTAKKSNQKIVGDSQKKIRLLELKKRIASKKYYPDFID